MEHIRITRIIPISDQILLLIFKDPCSKQHGAKCILHRLPDIRPKSDPEGFKSFIRKHEHIVFQWEDDICLSTSPAGTDTKTLELSVDEHEWHEIEEACLEMNVTADQLVAALLHFCTEPGAKDALSQYFSSSLTRKSD